MKTKQMVILVVTGVVLAGLAWWTSREPQAEGVVKIGQKLLPGLAVNRVDLLELRQREARMRLVKAGDVWTLADRYGYPADFQRIRQLLLGLADARIGQAFPVGDQQRLQMELTPETALVVTLKSGGEPLAEVLLGASRQATARENLPMGFGGMTDGRYAALPGESMAYLIGHALFGATVDVQSWLDTTLLEVPGDRFRAITIRNPGDGTFHLEKTAEGKWAFRDADDASVFAQDKAASLTGALRYLTLQDIADPALEDAALGFTDPYLFQVDTVDGIRYSLHLSAPVEGGQDRYLRIEVVPREGTETAGPVAEPSPGDPAADATNVVAEAEADGSRAAEEAAALAESLSGWTYRIAGFHANALTPARASLVQAPAAAEASADGE